MKILCFLFITLLIFQSCNLDSSASFKINSEKANEKFDQSILKDGDMIFQTSNSGQSLAIQKATDSKYSHVGIIFKINDKWTVLEAVQPVQQIPLEEFIARGDLKHFTISRLKDDSLIDEKKTQLMKDFFETIEGINYDIYFEWTDKTWYCSELVWKIYNHIGIEISPFEKFGQYNLNDPIVKQIIQERFKNGVNMDETVITPRGIHQSEMVEEIYTNY